MLASANDTAITGGRMKIICVDNFGKETVSDTLIAENVNKHYAVFIVNKLNEKFSGNYAQSYYRLVRDDHKLYKFEP